MRSRWFAPLCIVAMLIFGIAVYGRLPQQVASHWNIYGQVNGTLSRLAAVLLLPALGAVMMLLMYVLPRIDPLRASYSAFQGTFQLFINALVLFLAVLHVAQLGNALGWDIPMPRVAVVSSGLLLVVLGSQLGRVRPNWFVGIRTPWTLTDPQVWQQTHQLGGRVLPIVGALIALAALLLPVPAVTYVLLIGLLGASGLLVAYSYLLWRRRRPA